MLPDPGRARPTCPIEPPASVAPSPAMHAQHRPRRLALVCAPLALGGVLGLLAPAGPRGDALSFHVAQGTTLARSFASRQEASQDEVEMLLNGQPMPSGITNGMTLVQEQRLELSDEFVEPGPGRADAAPRVLRRSFLGIEASGEQSTENPMDAGRQEDRRHSKSELEGKTVVFEWDETQRTHSKRFDPEGPAIQLLEGLVEDTDFRALLPPEGAAEPGDTWDLDAAVISSLLMPAGNLCLVAEEGPDRKEGDPGALSAGDPSRAFAGLEGEVEATYKGARDVEGTRCGIIALEFKVHSKRDLKEELARFSHGDLEIERVEAFLSLEGEGELAWDLAQGHGRSLNLSGKLKNQMDVSMKLVQSDRTLPIRRKMMMSGTYELQANVERR